MLNDNYISHGHGCEFLSTNQLEKNFLSMTGMRRDYRKFFGENIFAAGILEEKLIA